MKLVIQRVEEASVKVDGEVVGAIGQGLLVLVGIEQEDTKEVAEAIAAAVSGVVVDVRGGVIVMTDKRTWTSLSQKKF